MKSSKGGHYGPPRLNRVKLKQPKPLRKTKLLIKKRKLLKQMWDVKKRKGGARKSEQEFWLLKWRLCKNVENFNAAMAYRAYNRLIFIMIKRKIFYHPLSYNQEPKIISLLIKIRFCFGNLRKLHIRSYMVKCIFEHNTRVRHLQILNMVAAKQYNYAQCESRVGCKFTRFFFYKQPQFSVQPWGCLRFGGKFWKFEGGHPRFYEFKMLFSTSSLLCTE